jgi:uncharacterized protein (TIGR01777 family)
MRFVRIIIAGASGFLGGKLTERLRADGHQIVRLVRKEPAGEDEISWQPAAGRLEPSTLAGAGAVVSLTGSPLGMRVGRLQVPVRLWTADYRREFRASRVGVTDTLARAIAAADPKPGVFLSASGTAWYGDTGDTEVDERSPAGSGFLADNCRAWEAATEPAERAGVRVVRLRTGFPLHKDGGLVGPQLLPYRLGLGGKLGNGRQWLPWISMTDWLEAAVFLLQRDDLAGPVNMVGPAPVRNAEFTRALGRLLHRPTVMPLPKPLLGLLVGEFGRDAAESKRVLPGVLNRAGFRFTHTDVDSALRAALAG